VVTEELDLVVGIWQISVVAMVLVQVFWILVLVHVVVA
jgi:hypothetical protein